MEDMDKIRKQAASDAAQAEADAKAAESARLADEATAHREGLEAQMVATAKETGVAEAEQQKGVDAAREAEKQAHEQADQDARDASHAGPAPGPAHPHDPHDNLPGSVF